ncbi:NifU family protein [Primorskyibacter flagellatus]|uniref:NifU family protein n=1 Tax=Primorskyibacter flagellatus TaxID=1387277 RepID=UPI003A8F96AE
MSETAHRIRIRVQPSPRDPETLRFLLDAPVQTGAGIVRFDGMAEDAPLSAALFAVAGVQQVAVDGPVIHIRKHATARWDAMKTPIAAAIRAVLLGTGAPLGNADEPRQGDADARLMEAVRALLASQINPSIAGHGGHIDVETVAEGTVYLRMSGGCQGCAASQLTLRGGVERKLRAALPDLRDIVDVTDHEAGAKPFYGDAPGESHNMRSPIAQEPAPLNADTPLAERLRQYLKALPSSDPTVSYGTLTRAFGFWRPGSVRKVTQALEVTMRDDAGAGHPFIAARAIGRASDGLPGKGFFDLARDLSRGPRDDETERAFHARELQRLEQATN